MSFDIIGARAYGTGALGDVTNPATVNHYAAITAVAGKTITISGSDLSAFTAGTEIFLHISGARTGSALAKHLGKWTFAKIMSVADNVLTLSTAAHEIDPADYFYQAVTVPHYKTLTISSTISPPAFDESTGMGGLFVIKCSSRLVMSGAINLIDKGLQTATYRPALAQEAGGTLDTDQYSGHENFDTLRHFTLQKGDGAACILAHTIDFADAARIGNPNLHGIARCRGAEDSYAKPTEYTNLGGSSILIAAKNINNFTPAVISKYRSKTLEAGKGLARAYIATESTLPQDEGLYASDFLNVPERLTTHTLIDGFGSGAMGIAKGPLVQQNNYARVAAMSSDGKTFKLTHITTEGIAQFERNTLVMVHAAFKAKNTYVNVGRFFLATIVGVSNTTSGALNTITLNHSAKELGLSNFDPDHNNFQIITIPQYSEFTLTGTNSKTPKWDGAGGIFAIAVNGTCDLSGGKIDVRARGGNRNSLDYISNANMKNRLPIGEGHGSIFILAKTLKMNTSTRLGNAVGNGNAFGGIEGTGATNGNETGPTSLKRGGYMGQRPGSVRNSYTGTGGSGTRGGQQLKGHNGGFCGNATDSADYSGLQGASIFIVAETIDGLCLDALSTGGQGGYLTSDDRKALDARAGTAGGCGYGGAGSNFAIGVQSNSGGCGGVHGGGSGSSNDDDSCWSGGGGSAGWCTIYCNNSTNQATTNLLFD